MAESYFQHADHFVRQLPEQKTPIVSNDNESGLNENSENEENLTTDNQDLDLASKKENSELPENTVSE